MTDLQKEIITSFINFRNNPHLNEFLYTQLLSEEQQIHNLPYWNFFKRRFIEQIPPTHIIMNLVLPIKSRIINIRIKIRDKFMKKSKKKSNSGKCIVIHST